MLEAQTARAHTAPVPIVDFESFSEHKRKSVKKDNKKDNKKERPSNAEVKAPPPSNTSSSVVPSKGACTGHLMSSVQRAMPHMPVHCCCGGPMHLRVVHCCCFCHPPP